MKKQVLLIDPWGTANTSEYLNGLIYGLDEFTELTVFTNHYFQLKTQNNADIHCVFFRNTEKMTSNRLRPTIRGIEYLYGYNQIIRYLKKNRKFDVIHINWLLKYEMDIYFLKALKKHTNKLVYTAHNVLPHQNGEKYIDKLRPIYSLCDKIILHGENVKLEFIEFFPEFEDKIYIQKHGCNIEPKTNYDETKISENIKEKIQKYKMINIFFGNVFFNKGVDRVVSAWNENWNESLLIIAGKHDGEYTELEKHRKKINSSENILELNGFVDDNTLNYLITKSDIILMPYRHASMSGVIFTACDFSKPILCTDVGALKEYLIDEQDAFIVGNKDILFNNKLAFINTNINKKLLEDMGNKLTYDIKEKCSWKAIGQGVVENCYIDKGRKNL